MDKEQKKYRIKNCIIFSILAIILILVIIMMLKYEVEGEKNIPFEISKIMVISTAEGVNKEGTEENKNWNLDIMQDNDIYISIKKNENNNKDEIIEKIIMENIKITKIPSKGTVKIYMPNSSDGSMYKFLPEFEVIDRLEYKGAVKGNAKTLEVANQGGMVQLRCANINIGEYISEQDDTIKHDGTLLKKVETNLEELKFGINFDFIIKLKNKSYKTNISLEFPEGDILENGTATMTKEDMSDLIFKRINNNNL